MKVIDRYFTGFALFLLALCLVFGIVSSISYMNIEGWPKTISFEQARPFHVSGGLFWILSAAVAGIIYYNRIEGSMTPWLNLAHKFFALFWVTSIMGVFISYSMQVYGGREYWEFPAWINVGILLAWVILLVGYASTIKQTKDQRPVYEWMWGTGLLFFLFTFLEQNLWHIPWIRETFIREMTAQWKANGSMVGAWNQMIYGTAIYLMVKISGDDSVATSKKAYASYLLGLTNLIFNWGHHIYNVPTSLWVRNISYLVSMTEWVLIISIIQGFRKQLNNHLKYGHLFSYRLLAAAEYWVALNLLLALLMSIPAINRYTHGTHITVAHAMGTTIGINTMILLASIAYMSGLDKRVDLKTAKLNFGFGFWFTQIPLFIFWVALIGAGIVKGIQMTDHSDRLFSDVMKKVEPWLKVFMYAGFALVIGLMQMIWVLGQQLFRKNTTVQPLSP